MLLPLVQLLQAQTPNLNLNSTLQCWLLPEVKQQQPRKVQESKIGNVNKKNYAMDIKKIDI